MKREAGETPARLRRRDGRRIAHDFAVMRHQPLHSAGRRARRMTPKSEDLPNPFIERGLMHRTTAPTVVRWRRCGYAARAIDTLLMAVRQRPCFIF
jgi:hypothetical protein